MPRSEWTPKTESCCALDIGVLQRNGYLSGCYQSSISWSTRSGERMSIGLRGDLPDNITLQYSFVGEGGRVVSVDEKVYLTTSICHFGGERAWFLCPACGRRVGVLFLRGGYFRCRTCHGVRYRCKSESVLDRAIRKRRKIEERLGGQAWLKPKGMHQATFDRLRQRLQVAEVAETYHFTRGAYFT